MKHISDSEKMVIAKCNRLEKICSEQEKKIESLKQQLEWAKIVIENYKHTNKTLCQQINYLVSLHSKQNKWNN